MDSPLVDGEAPQPGLFDWLTYRGLLTVRLKQSCAQGFRLQVLENGSGPGLMVAEARIRRVILWCGETACVYAESFLPHEALALLPGLRRLGNDPLGEMLRSHADVSRGAFEYALLQSPPLPTPISDLSGTPLWARRSKFTVGQSSLTVAEAFLPGLLNL